MKINTNRWNRLRYTLYAPFYDRVATFGRQRRRSISLLSLQPGERVLVDGAGTGRDLDFIPHGVDAVATDLTPGMVERIRDFLCAQPFPWEDDLITVRLSYGISSTVDPDLPDWQSLLNRADQALLAAKAKKHQRA